MTGTISKRLRTFWANPVVTRDLRVRMRGSKSYWHQALYLLLVGLLALVGYGTAVGWGDAGDPNGLSVVEVQRQLQSFYYFIFLTLAALITLIAPALTAVSITTERQRLSLDLLVTTPLSASELLVGKMISSVAFLALLLTLSLPASALCVILGGATLGDVIRVYLLLAIDGLVLAAIGLAVSCAVRASLPALVWSYLLVAAFLVVTTFLYATMGSPGRGFSASGTSPVMAIGVLDPFIAVLVGAQSFPLFSVSVPLWVGAAVVAFLLIRLLVTAGAYRLGRYGGQPIGSLRRQLLFVSAVTVFGLTYSFFQRSALGTGLAGSGESSSGLETMLLIVFLFAAFLLPSLFTPAAASEDDPPGLPVRGVYAVRGAFRPEHAGALPFFHLWLLSVMASAAAGIALTGNFEAENGMCVLLTAFYLSGLGFLFWSIARRAATFVAGVTAARALSFIIFAVSAWLPIAALSILYAGMSGADESNDLLAHLWLLYPVMKLDPSAWREGVAPTALLWTGALAYGVGALLYPAWRDVVPGGRRRKEALYVPTT